MAIPALVQATVFNVRDHGAKGDGVALDSPAINAAIEAAAKQGGGKVVLPAGTYLSFSIRLKSNITLHLEKGAVLLAATPAEGFGAYDPPEPNEWGDKLQYQDFGHSHWQNSLIWGDGLQNIAITGPGLIDGTKGLVRNAGYGGGGRRTGPNGTVAPGTSPSPAPRAPDEPRRSPQGEGGPASPAPQPQGPGAGQGPRSPVGLGNKAIGLKNCRDVTLRDFSILNGGHFALLATGVDDLKITDVIVDTNRDGFDIDACQRVQIENCRVNAPNDDAIVLKTSFALGEVRPTRNVTIRGCTITGFDPGTVLDGTRQRKQERAPDRDGPTGRIKIGTESNGAFYNIDITGCSFERSRGIALEVVDGGQIDDVLIAGIRMREVTNPPIFIRLGDRARGPAGTPVGSIRKISITDVTAEDSDARYGAVLIAGLPGHPIEDVFLANIRVVSKGGITTEMVAAQPAELVNTFFLRGDEPGITGPRDPLAVPLRAKAYPEPSMFGLIPAGAIYARHVRNLKVSDLKVSFTAPDTRPRVVLDDAIGVTLTKLDVAPSAGSGFWLRAVKKFTLKRSPGVPDTRHDDVEKADF